MLVEGFHKLPPLKFEMASEHRGGDGDKELPVAVEAVEGVAGSAGDCIPGIEDALGVEPCRESVLTYEQLHQDVHPDGLLSRNALYLPVFRHILVLRHILELRHIQILV